MSEYKVFSQPDLFFVKKIARDFCGEQSLSIERFSTGNCHFVFDIKSKNKSFVLRIAYRENKEMLRGALFWSNLLRPKGIPLPKILAVEMDAKFPFMVLERFEGEDLWMIYSTLSVAEKKTLARQVTQFQTIAKTLPGAKNFGYLENYESRAGCKIWIGLLQKMLKRSRDRIKEVGIFDVKIVDEVEANLSKYKKYLSGIEPIPFFHDITTKNVIIHQGNLSGIVDVDSMCFGDSIQTIGLTKMALLQDGEDLDYIDYWADEMNLDKEQKNILNFYTSISCVDFISEIGQTFNQQPNLPIDYKRAEKLHIILKGLLKSH